MTSMYFRGEIGAGYVHSHTEAQPLWQAHAHWGGVWLRATDVTLYVQCTTIRARADNKRYRTPKYLRFLQWLVKNYTYSLESDTKFNTMKPKSRPTDSWQVPCFVQVSRYISVSFLQKPSISLLCRVPEKCDQKIWRDFPSPRFQPLVTLSKNIDKSSLLVFLEELWSHTNISSSTK